MHKHTPYLPSWTPILEYMTEQFDKYLNEEVSINRKKVIPDTRVHCCLYFIPPTGHRSVCCSILIVVVMMSHPHTFTPLPSLHYSLRPIDVEFMKRLHHCVNIVPVIAKADTLTIEERDAFKLRVSHGRLLVCVSLVSAVLTVI